MGNLPRTPASGRARAANDGVAVRQNMDLVEQSIERSAIHRNAVLGHDQSVGWPQTRHCMVMAVITPQDAHPPELTWRTGAGMSVAWTMVTPMPANEVAAGTPVVNIVMTWPGAMLIGNRTSGVGALAKCENRNRREV